MNQEETDFRKGMLEAIAICTRMSLYDTAKEYLAFYKEYTQGITEKLPEIGATIEVWKVSSS